MKSLKYLIPAPLFLLEVALIGFITNGVLKYKNSFLRNYVMITIIYFFTVFSFGQEFEFAIYFIWILLSIIITLIKKFISKRMKKKNDKMFSNHYSKSNQDIDKD